MLTAPRAPCRGGDTLDAPLLRPSPPQSVGDRVRDWVYWFGLGRLVTIAGSVLAIGAGGYWLLSPSPPPVEASLPMVSTTPAGAGSTDSTKSTDTAPPASSDPVPEQIVVHVAGAVLVPGVHQVAGDARVADAVLAAGGLAADAHSDAVNLAAPVHDGDRIYIPRVVDGVAVPVGVSAAVVDTASATGVPAAVALNSATAEQLDQLPGVGPATAAAIIAHRDVNGPFASIDSLGDVRGIGPAKLEALRPLVTL